MLGLLLQNFALSGSAYCGTVDPGCSTLPQIETSTLRAGTPKLLLIIDDHLLPVR
jgi:hypothetical protein